MTCVGSCSQSRSTFQPTSCSALVVATVTSDVAVEPGLPPRAVGLRVRSVLWTSMPEAPVDEDRQPVSRECDVDATTKAGNGGVVLAEAVSARVQGAAKSALRRALPTIADHDLPRGSRTRRRRRAQIHGAVRWACGSQRRSLRTAGAVPDTNVVGPRRRRIRRPSGPRASPVDLGSSAG